MSNKIPFDIPKKSCMKLYKYFLMSFPAEGVCPGKNGHNLSDSKPADASFELVSGFFIDAGLGGAGGCDLGQDDHSIRSLEGDAACRQHPTHGSLMTLSHKIPRPGKSSPRGIIA